MKVLLDTYILLWAAYQPASLSDGARAAIDDPENEPLFSAASIWEVSIKAGLGREDFTADPRVLRRGLLDNGYLELPVTGAHAAAVLDLPPLHKDPFDRILLAQARFEGILLLTDDRQLLGYRRPVIEL